MSEQRWWNTPIQERIERAREWMARGQARQARRELELALATDIDCQPAWALLAKLPAAAAETIAAWPKPSPRFEVRGLLGRGGTGKVYLALDYELQDQVALKIFDEGLELGALLHGVRLAAKLLHPRLLPALDLEPELRLLSMPYIAGGSLKERPATRLDWPTWRQCLLEALEGLLALHQAGLAHLDVKPGNLLVGERGLILSDFSLCRHTPGIPPGGSVDYAAPEALLGEMVGPEADVYSLGIVAYEMACGRRPFPTALPIRTRQVEPLLSRRQELPPPAAELVHRMLELEPEARPSALELIHCLRQLS